MRHALAVVGLLLSAAFAVAQPVRKGPPIDLVAAPPPCPPVMLPWIRPPLWGGYYGGFYSEFMLPIVSPAPRVPLVRVPQPPAVTAVNPARIAEDTDRAAALASATLTLQLPAAADVRLNGEPQASSADTTRTLSSAPLKLGSEFKFNVRARWVEGGITYEATPSSTVRAGERGQLTVYAGTPVK
jgi:uncharacterized protein (TIGR03000 family)